MVVRHKQPDAVTERTNEAIVKLKKYYDLGRRAQKLSSSAEGPYAKGVIAQLVEESGESKATVNKCRQFADMYSPDYFYAVAMNGILYGLVFGRRTRIAEEALEVIGRQCRERAGFEITTACDGMQALALLDRVSPDLLLLDILMPRLDGR